LQESVEFHSNDQALARFLDWTELYRH